MEGPESGIGVTIRRKQHCNFLLSVLCAEAEDSHFDDALKMMQSLVPHLRRAFEWYRRSERGAFDLFEGHSLAENLRLGIVTIGAGRKVRTANAVATAIMERAADLGVDRAGRFH